MPLGTICQLNYYGGGRLQYQDSCGNSLHLSFEKAPYLRVGQQVSFSINHSPGRDEATNVVPMNSSQTEATNLLPVMQTRKRKFALEPEESESLTCAVIRGEKQDLAVADLPESGSGKPLASSFDSDSPKAKESMPSRKLQQSMGKYHNADMQERLQLITRAEEGLEQLLAGAEIDGDALGKLVCRCAGWLHSPHVFGKFGNAVGTKAESTRDASSCSENSNLQSRLRRLLIRALSHLDLTDDVTRTVVETPLVYIQDLIKEIPQSSVSSKVAKQWQALQSLVSTPQRPPADSHVATPEKRQGQGPRKGAATIAGGTFQPSQKVQNMPNVFTQNQSVSLTCSHCGHKISSKWFWRHPRTGIVHVLARDNGHIVCTTKLGKKVPWIVDGDIMPLKNDHSTELDLCDRRFRVNVVAAINSDCMADQHTDVRFAERSAILCLAFCCQERCLSSFKMDGHRMFISLFWFYDVLSARHLLRNHCVFFLP